MHVICKKCGAKIVVANRPRGSTRTSGIRLDGNLRVEGGGITFGPGAKLVFGPGGSVSFGPPAVSEFTCMDCGHGDSYSADDIKD